MTPAAADGARAWRLVSVDGGRLIRCRPLESLSGVAHAFSTCVGPGGSILDVGGPEVPGGAAGRAWVARAAGLESTHWPLLRQVHGNRVLTGDAVGAGPAEADGVLCRRGVRADPPAAVRTADCLPLLLADAEGAVVGAVHAGWRGTAAGIAGLAVERMVGLGASPRRLIAALGPTIGACCYEVGPEVVEAVAAASGGDPVPLARPRRGRFLLDLAEANAIQLRDAGLEPANVHRAPWCTVCETGLLHSFRRSGAAAGRQVALIGWSGGSDLARGSA